MYVGNCAEFTQHWDEITSIFSRDAVLKGSFDRYAESSKAKKGTAEVDTAFLKEIESWRDALARNLALRNPELTQRPELCRPAHHRPHHIPPYLRRSEVLNGMGNSGPYRMATACMSGSVSYSIEPMNAIIPVCFTFRRKRPFWNHPIH